MADIRKEQERDELHRAIWAIADELRGAVVGLAQAAQLAKRLGIIIKEEQERPPERP